MAEILDKKPELVDKVTKKLKVLEDKAEEFFEMEEDDYLAESKEILRMKIGSKMLDGYKNIDMLNTGDCKPLVDLGDNMKELNEIIDSLTPMTTQKVEKQSTKFIPEKLLGDKNENAGQMMIVKHDSTSQGESGKETALDLFSKSKQRQLGAIYIDKIKKIVKPKWHAPWQLKRVIVGHKGWVNCVDFDNSNEWFVTGSNDRTIKFWDLASLKLKLTLTGHVGSVMDVKVDPRHTYMYSCGTDKTVRCWDLVTNKAIRNYHGHLSGVYALDIHPTIDIIATGGRDSTVRIWDIRTKAEVMVFEGHSNTIESIAMQEFEPQVVSGSHDKTIRMWDLSTGKSFKCLTNHKKGVKSLVFHPKEYTFCSSGQKLKVWKCPEGRFLRNFAGHNAIINTMAINEDNVLVSGGDDGSLHFWDWKSGYNFQRLHSKPQPGSIAAEACIKAAKFDKSGLRLVTTEADKSIKIWCQDEEATPETHPIDPNYREFVKNQQNY